MQRPVFSTLFDLQGVRPSDPPTLTVPAWDCSLRKQLSVRRATLQTVTVCFLLLSCVTASLDYIWSWLLARGLQDVGASFEFTSRDASQVSTFVLWAGSSCFQAVWRSVTCLRRHSPPRSSSTFNTRHSHFRSGNRHIVGSVDSVLPGWQVSRLPDAYVCFSFITSIESVPFCLLHNLQSSIGKGNLYI